MTRLALREAGPEDAAAVTAFHLRIWRDTYRDLAPPEAQRLLDHDLRLRGWTATLALPPPHGVVLATEGERILAFVAFGPTETPAFQGRGRIGQLYVDHDQRGRGIGARLLRVAQSRLRAAGFPGTALSVVVGNNAARAFYRAQGGVEAGRFTDPGPIWRSDNILMVWD